MISPELKAEVKTRWAGMEANQKKLALFVPCLLFALLLATHPLHWLERGAVRRRPAPVAGTQAVTASAVANADGAAPGASPLQSPGIYAGKYEGHGKIGTGMCDLQLEIRALDAGKFTGYPALSCTPLPSYFVTGKADNNPAAYLDMLQKAAPITALLSGTVKDGALQLTVDRITSNEPTCRWQSFTIIPFGSSGITAQWADSCGGGSLLMKKLPTPRGTR